MRFCIFCGAEIRQENARFCARCGAPVEGAETEGLKQNEPAEPQFAPGSRPLDGRPGESGAVQTERKKPSGEVTASEVAHRLEKMFPEEPKLPKKRGKAILFALLALAVLAGAAAGGVWYLQSPGRAAAAFARAAERGDTDYLRENILLADGSALGQTDAENLSNLLSSDDRMLEGVTERLKDSASEPEATGGYDSFVLERRKGFLSGYQVLVRPVELLILAEEDGALRINGGAEEWLTAGEEHVFTSPVPGRFRLTWRADGPEESRGLIQLSSSEALRESFGDPSETFTVSVACAYPDAVIFLDGEPTDIVPENGLAVIPEARVGTVISAEAWDDGKPVSASVRVESREGTELAFSFYGLSEEESGEPAPEDARVFDTALAYYTSYIASINEMDPGLLTNTTEENRETVDYKIHHNNRDYLFDFYEMNVDLDTLKYEEMGGLALASFRARVRYDYTMRDGGGDWEEDGNIQDFFLVFDGEMDGWKVSYTEIMPEETEIGDHIIVLAPKS